MEEWWQNNIIATVWLFLQGETSIEAHLLSEFANQNAITVPLSDADEDFTKTKINSWQKEVRNISSELFSK